MVKKCKCGSEFEPINYPGSKIKTTKCVPCLIKKGRELKDRQIKKQLQEAHKQLKTIVRNNDKKTRTRATREFCHSYIRARDRKLACISCGATIIGSGHASHYFDSGQFSAIRYDEQNIHRSCEQCNTHGHGNKTGYRAGLIERYGIGYVNQLEAKKDLGRNKKWSIEELLQLENYYKLKIKQV